MIWIERKNKINSDANMNEEHFWKNILKEIELGNPSVVVTIINREGSAPNIPGAKMFVNLDSIGGTVGGGLSESRLLELAKTILKEKDFSVKTVHMEHNENADDNRSGMICSGSQTFALTPLSKDDKPTIEMIIEAYTKTKLGVLSISNKGINVDFGDLLTHDKSYSGDDHSWSYRENIGFQDKFFIIGGGHVSLALSNVIATLGFHITVLDDRKNLPTMAANTCAHVKDVISYKDISSIIPEGNNIYVVIMTYGHQSDELVLESIISKKCRYIGMMASAAKKQQIFTNLEEKGISKDLLNNIYSPIGIGINSNTPEEIAVSIAAELIKVKNSNSLN